MAVENVGGGLGCPFGSVYVGSIGGNGRLDWGVRGCTGEGVGGPLGSLIRALNLL